jgi:hypothetical protein
VGALGCAFDSKGRMMSLPTSVVSRRKNFL